MARYDGKYWIAHIRAGEEFRKKTSNEPEWEQFAKYYQNEVTNPLDPSFNLVHMMGSSLLPTLIFQNPHIMNTARRPEFAMSAKIFDGIDNQWFEHIRAKEIGEDLIIRAYLYNTVGLEIGYEFGDDSDDVYQQIAGTVDPRKKTNYPWLDVIDSNRLVFPEDTVDSYNTPWYGKLITMPLYRAKQIPFLKGKDLRPSEGVTRLDKIRRMATGKAQTVRDVDPVIDFYEIHCQETGKAYWLSLDGIMYHQQEDPLQIDGLPLEVLTFNKGVNTCWGSSDVSLVQTMHLEGNECRMDGRMQRKHANTKFFYDVDMIDEGQLDRFISGEVTATVGVRVGQGKSLRDVIMPAGSHVNQEYMEYQKALLNDAQLITGHGPNQIGTFAPGRRTKREVDIVESTSQVRTAIRRDKVAKVFERQVVRGNTIIRKYWTAQQIFPIIGIEGAVYWVEVDPIKDELFKTPGDITTSINVESMAPTSRETRKAEMMELLGILSQFEGMEQQAAALVQHFITQFDWGAVIQNLPTASPQTMNAAQFQQEQQMLSGGGGQQPLAQQQAGNLQGLAQTLGPMQQAQPPV